jgi:hypothetical protein
MYQKPSQLFAKKRLLLIGAACVIIIILATIFWLVFAKKPNTKTGAPANSADSSTPYQNDLSVNLVGSTKTADADAMTTGGFQALDQAGLSASQIKTVTDKIKNYYHAKNQNLPISQKEVVAELVDGSVAKTGDAVDFQIKLLVSGTVIDARFASGKLTLGGVEI